MNQQKSERLEILPHLPIFPKDIMHLLVPTKLPGLFLAEFIIFSFLRGRCYMFAINYVPGLPGPLAFPRFHGGGLRPEIRVA